MSLWDQSHVLGGFIYSVVLTSLCKTSLMSLILNQAIHNTLFLTAQSFINNATCSNKSQMFRQLVETGELQELEGMDSTLHQNYTSSRACYISPVYQASVMVPQVISAPSVNDLKQQGHVPRGVWDMPQGAAFCLLYIRNSYVLQRNFRVWRLCRLESCTRKRILQASILTIIFYSQQSEAYHNSLNRLSTLGYFLFYIANSK